MVKEKTYSDKIQDPRWQKVRLLVLERDGWACLECGDTESTLHVHHVCYNGDPWETPLERLRTLCKECHEMETEDLKTQSSLLISTLKQQGFTSMGMAALQTVFMVDRGWTDFDPAYSILKHAIETEDLWCFIYQKYFDHLAERRKAIKEGGPF